MRPTSLILVSAMICSACAHKSIEVRHNTDEYRVAQPEVVQEVLQLRSDVAEIAPTRQYVIEGAYLSHHRTLVAHSCHACRTGQRCPVVIDGAISTPPGERQ